MNVSNFFDPSRGGVADVNDIGLLGLESAMVYGPLSFQAEYFHSAVDRSSSPEANFNGAYGFVSYFLTGEHRPYNRQTGVWDRVKPNENFFRVRTGEGDVCTGMGAWEVVYRYSLLDLNDGLVQGGFVRDHTLGLNWYLNPYTRLMWNYVNSHVDRTVNNVDEGTMDIFEMRFAIDF